MDSLEVISSSLGRQFENSNEPQVWIIHQSMMPVGLLFCFIHQCIYSWHLAKYILPDAHNAFVVENMVLLKKF